MAHKKKELSVAHAFDVYLDGELIDTVNYYGNHTQGEVRRDLIHHDGYDKDIKVIYRNTQETINNGDTQY